MEIKYNILKFFMSIWRVFLTPKVIRDFYVILQCKVQIRNGFILSSSMPFQLVGYALLPSFARLTFSGNKSLFHCRISVHGRTVGENRVRKPFNAWQKSKLQNLTEMTSIKDRNCKFFTFQKKICLDLKNNSFHYFYELQKILQHL